MRIENHTSNLTAEDRELIDEILADELEYDFLVKLDEKMKNPAFRVAFEEALDKKYQRGLRDYVRDYVPFGMLIFLVLIGIYLGLLKG